MGPCYWCVVSLWRAWGDLSEGQGQVAGGRGQLDLEEKDSAKVKHLDLLHVYELYRQKPEVWG